MRVFCGRNQRQKRKRKTSKLTITKRRIRMAHEVVKKVPLNHPTKNKNHYNNNDINNNSHNSIVTSDRNSVFSQSHLKTIFSNPFTVVIPNKSNNSNSRPKKLTSTLLSSLSSSSWSWRWYGSGSGGSSRGDFMKIKKKVVVPAVAHRFLFARSTIGFSFFVVGIVCLSTFGTIQPINGFHLTTSSSPILLGYNNDKSNKYHQSPDSTKTTTSAVTKRFTIKTRIPNYIITTIIIYNRP